LKKIFVVDDNTLNLLVAEEALSELYDVYTMSSGTLMFSLLNNVFPDLILLDLLMPEISGFEILSRLKDDKRYSGIPVIILTSKIDANTETLGFQMGAVDFITKPFSKSALLDRILAHLNI